MVRSTMVPESSFLIHMVTLACIVTSGRNITLSPSKNQESISMIIWMNSVLIKLMGKESSHEMSRNIRSRFPEEANKYI